MRNHIAIPFLGGRGQQAQPHGLQGTRAVPGEASQSPSSMSHITPRLSEIGGLFPGRAV